jgi:hypothetical protein
MARAERFASEAGCSCVRLDAFSGHAGLLEFYERIGYSEVARARASGREMVCFERRVQGKAPTA